MSLKIKSKACKVVFIISFWIILLDVKAHLILQQVVDKDLSDPLTGKINLRHIPTGCGPYNITLKGETTMYFSEKLNQNPKPFHILSFSSLPADHYEIKILDNTGCTYSLFAQVKSCVDFDIIIKPVMACKNEARVTAYIDPRPYPLNWEWFKRGGARIHQYHQSNNLGLCNVNTGDYIVKITDSAGCMSMKYFNVSNFEWKLEAKREYACRGYDLVTVLVKNKHGTTFSGRNFVYSWHDGIIYSSTSSVKSRLISAGIKSEISVTDVATQCQLITSSEATSRPPGEPHQIHRIQSLRHDIDKNKKGEVSIIIQENLKKPLQLILYKNNKFLSETFLNNHFYQIKNLSAGHYNLEVFEGGIYKCQAGFIEFDIYTCDAPKHKNKMSIDVQSKRLPLDREGFFVNFKVNNSGGPCLFKYSMEGDNIAHITKSTPSINYEDGQKIVPYIFRRNLKVEAFCPCGYVSKTLDVYPCKRNFVPKARLEKITQFSKVDHPNDGHEINNEIASIELEYNLLGNFIWTPEGDTVYLGYLRLMQWSDGAPVKVKVRDKTLRIQRTFTSAGPYTLLFIDGLGCGYTNQFIIN